jgi:hypothetical protein
MRKYQGIEGLLNDFNGDLNKNSFAALIMDDLLQANCNIFGETIDDELVLLAELKFQQDSLVQSFGIFNQTIEFVVTGKIINNKYPALTYRVDMGTFQFYGRCSTIAQICGVDLYLDKSYTEKVGDSVSQKFSISVNPLFKTVKK